MLRNHAVNQSLDTILAPSTSILDHQKDKWHHYSSRAESNIPHDQQSQVASLPTARTQRKSFLPELNGVTHSLPGSLIDTIKSHVTMPSSSYNNLKGMSIQEQHLKREPLNLSQSVDMQAYTRNL
jgi:hypothetical protein